VDRYIDDLMEGCRCVELDCWDSSDGTGEPCIYHGGTLTSKISFRDVVEAIADFGFKNSPYPIVLSFENHCSAPFQVRMAFHLKELLLARNLLWLPPESTLQPGGAGAPATELPSPHAAMFKVLIKAKVARFKKKVTAAAAADLSDQANPDAGTDGKRAAEGAPAAADDLKGLDAKKDLEEQEQDTIDEVGVVRTKAQRGARAHTRQYVSQSTSCCWVIKVICCLTPHV
jgi:hypothetical protein